MTIPWGDVSTAHFTTGIPNITVFTGVPKNTYTIMKFQKLFNPIVSINFVRNQIQKYVDKNITGPSMKHNEKKEIVHLWKSNQCKRRNGGSKITNG
jgi:short subunit dehydrogenase-like uncharacterized protein